MKQASLYIMPSSIALGCGGYEAYMQQILTPNGV